MHILIGEQVRQLRKQKKMSQVQLSRRTGLDRTYISKIENDNANLTVDTLLLICKALEVSMTEFFSILQI